MAKSARITRESVIARGRFDLTRTDVEVVEDDGVTRRLSHEVYRHGKAAAVLQETLDEERAADEKLTSIATRRVNVEATQTA
jgi:hypothetical protein